MKKNYNNLEIEVVAVDDVICNKSITADGDNNVPFPTSDDESNW